LEAELIEDQKMRKSEGKKEMEGRSQESGIKDQGTRIKSKKTEIRNRRSEVRMPPVAL
jgi:hypothetical protein